MIIVFLINQVELDVLLLCFYIPYFKPNYLSQYLQFVRLLQSIDIFDNNNLLFNNNVNDVKIR